MKTELNRYLVPIQTETIFAESWSNQIDYLLTELYQIAIINR
jgi:hypothetical protein